MKLLMLGLLLATLAVPHKAHANASGTCNWQQVCGKKPVAPTTGKPAWNPTMFPKGPIPEWAKHNKPMTQLEMNRLYHPR